jgi:hypothetical protein
MLFSGGRPGCWWKVVILANAKIVPSSKVATQNYMYGTVVSISVASMVRYTFIPDDKRISLPEKNRIQASIRGTLDYTCSIH